MATNQDDPFNVLKVLEGAPMRARTLSLTKWPPSAQNDKEKDIQVQLKNVLEELTKIKKENEELKKALAQLTQQNTQKKISYSPANSSEEEELVARETAWVLNMNKKRKLKHSPEKIKATTTRENNKSTPAKTTKLVKPPPVIISNLTNYTQVNSYLSEANINYKASVLNNNQLKVNVESENQHRDLTKLLNHKKIEWHSYENKQNRPIRVIVKNLHPTYDVNDIKDDLLDKGLKVLDVHNKIKKKKIGENYVNIPLPLFMLTFDHSEDIKKIYEIKYICHTKVSIEPLRQNKLIAQCKRCQRYGHTYKYCQRMPACVKCAGLHLTSECNIPKNTRAKCFNCGEEHPASYRGCIVAKELQKRRNALLKNKDAEARVQPRVFQSKKVNEQISYAQTAKDNEIQTNNTKQDNIKDTLQQVLKSIDALTERIDKIESRYTGTIPKRPLK